MKHCRLNLYRTRADTYGMVNIATNCCKLEHLNIGAICDLGYNEVSVIHRYGVLGLHPGQVPVERSHWT